MAGVGVWKLGGVEKTKLKLKEVAIGVIGRVQGGTGGSYSRLSGGLPR